ncbi:MAG: S9 family peptidase [Planctomycetota bacterium]|jgi:dipeptidyl aminopeptidase/acylaminoacyl peptidase
MAAAGSVMVSDLQVAPGGEIWWLEQRPAEDGRTVAVRWRDGACRDMTPTGFIVRSRVHEYGGGAMRIAGGSVILVRDPDGSLWRMPISGGDPEPLTRPEDGRFADIEPDPARHRLLAVREPAGGGGPDARTTIVAVGLDDGRVETLIDGPDFTASPRLSPCGGELAWLEWDHPDMPWDASRLLRATLDAGGRPSDRVPVAGGRGGPGEEGESIVEPAWTPGGELLFMSDRDGWWGLYRHAPTAAEGIEVVFRAQADLARVPWKLATRSWAIAAPRGIIAGVRLRGRTRLVLVPGRRATGRRPRVLDDSWARIEAIAADGTTVAAVATHPSRPTAILRLDLLSEECEVIREVPVPRLEAAFVPEPRMLRFPGADGEPTFAWLHPPANPDWEGPAEDRPPLLVRVHGGPTGAARLDYDLELRFWTSRGWAVCDIDHGGSAGYGRAYRRRLEGRWGEMDVADCVAVVRHLAEERLIDPARTAITGGSAGGYTTLMALATTDAFAAGASRFGIADLERFRETTHRFESRYLDRLIGPWPADRETFRHRSPIHRLDGFTRPLAVFQGLEDRVVPPEQSDMIVAALEARDVPVAYERFEDEQHGFRSQAALQRTLVVMDRFLREHLGIRRPE